MRYLVLLLMLVVTACNTTGPRSRGPEALSLLGKPLPRIEPDPSQREKLQANLAAAQAAFKIDPSEENYIWLGRRLAYLGRFHEAIAVYSEGLQKYPKSAKLYRHRGHRYITIRQVDTGLRDLTQAIILTKDQPDEIEPDGAPNARNSPRSSLKSNIWYHSGLGHYLNGEFSRAYSAWDMGMNFSKENDDRLVSTSYWLYLARKRAGDHAGAAAVLRGIKRDMDVIENQSYHKLLLCYKGEITPEEVGAGTDPVASATLGYGLAVRKLIEGDQAGAKADFERIIAGPNWSAFGYIAAEAELARTAGR